MRSDDLDKFKDEVIKKAIAKIEVEIQENFGRMLQKEYEFKVFLTPLLCCPFCGEKPKTGQCDLGIGNYVACEDNTCPAEPCVVGETLEIATRKWNARAA